MPNGKHQRGISGSRDLVFHEAGFVSKYNADIQRRGEKVRITVGPKTFSAQILSAHHQPYFWIKAGVLEEGKRIKVKLY